MSIREVLSKRLDGITPTTSSPSLKTGQIVQGKIVKIYPNNKAQIQIGTQKLVAQLEVSLSIGENYHFQVQKNSDVIHLKVIGDPLQQNTRDNMKMLLQGLGIKTAKSNIALMQHLMKDKVPFDREHLVKAFQLVENAPNKVQAQSVIKDMLVHKLPLTDSVFQALYTKSASGFSDQMNNLLLHLKQDLNQTPLKQHLIDRLALLTEPVQSDKGTVIKHVLTELESNKNNFFHALKGSGIIDNDLDFNTWKTEWQNFAKNNFGTTSSAHITLPNQSLKSASLPFQLNSTDLITELNQMMSNKSQVVKQAQLLLQQFSSLINKANIHQVSLSSSEFSNLNSQVKSELLPLLTEKQQVQLKTLENNPKSLIKLQTTLKTLTNEQLYAQIEKLVYITKADGQLLATKPHEQFLIQLKNVIQSTGFAHEFNLANDLPDQHSNTVKSMVMQLLQQSDGVINERAQQLLQFITGSQIQSVNETTNFLQANLQIPGNKLGLNNDLELEFESRKTESGKIDPDYCRVVFYLDLSNLKETVIDMNIQKRAVAVTVFNDNNEIKNHASVLKPILTEGLKELDYQLSTINVKPIQKVESNTGKLESMKEFNSQQGVDYRI
ncbi:hypothetical protein VBD025_12540 [Virgibacillus flavescens]|uniref:hypothetical protein n=1 Tax=Virgibacillus flavescens TaxID=1611422 RepID=UPI003D35945F